MLATDSQIKEENMNFLFKDVQLMCHAELGSASKKNKNKYSETSSE